MRIQGYTNTGYRNNEQVLIIDRTLLRGTRLKLHYPIPATNPMVHENHDTNSTYAMHNDMQYNKQTHINRITYSKPHMALSSLSPKPIRSPQSNTIEVDDEYDYQRISYHKGISPIRSSSNRYKNLTYVNSTNTLKRSFAVCKHNSPAKLSMEAKFGNI